MRHIADRLRAVAAELLHVTTAGTACGIKISTRCTDRHYEIFLQKNLQTYTPVTYHIMPQRVSGV